MRLYALLEWKKKYEERKMLVTVTVTYSKYFLNKYVFKLDLNLAVVEEFFRYDGMIFQSEGAAWAKDRSP